MMHPRKGEFFSSRVRYISLNQIRPNPQQPRRSFDEDSLSELAESIRSYGILQPLTVRRQGTGYELVAGERRLRAAAMAGLREVPCLVAQVGEEDSALLALMENLQRRDLDCWEEAEALSRLIARYGLSQEEAARRLGRSQPAVANKLRLLRLPDSVRQFLQENGLTERHARALLRLGTEEQQLSAAQAHRWHTFVSLAGFSAVFPIHFRFRDTFVSFCIDFRCAVGIFSQNSLFLQHGNLLRLHP